MKKILLIAALMAAALVGRAQSEADSVSVMLRHLQDTNTELVALNKAYTTHAFMVEGGAAVMTAGFLWARGTEGETLSTIREFVQKKAPTDGRGSTLLSTK